GVEVLGGVVFAGQFACFARFGALQSIEELLGFGEVADDADGAVGGARGLCGGGAFELIEEASEVLHNDGFGKRDGGDVGFGGEVLHFEILDRAIGGGYRGGGLNGKGLRVVNGVAAAEGDVVAGDLGDADGESAGVVARDGEFGIDSPAGPDDGRSGFRV